MTTIQQLPTVSNLSLSDLLVTWNTTNSDSRKFSITALRDLIQANLTAAYGNTATFTTYVQVTGVLTAYLPAPSAAIQGARATVTDSNQTLTAGIGATVAGGGANVVPVFCNGTNWVIG